MVTIFAWLNTWPALAPVTLNKVSMQASTDELRTKVTRLLPPADANALTSWVAAAATLMRSEADGLRSGRP
jgi:hypothetical protein